LISDRTEKDRGGAELTGDGLGFRRIGSGSSDSGDAELLGACGGDDDVRLGVASKKVVAATWIRVRGRAERRLEVAVSAGLRGAISAAWPLVRGEDGVQREMGGWVFMEGSTWARD
jgi:hypothetical protein